jgi:carbon storage regulator
MLVLSRKLGQRIVIDDRITITVQRIHPGDVQLAIDAPREVKVYRQEIADAINRNHQSEP